LAAEVGRSGQEQPGGGGGGGGSSLGRLTPHRLLSPCNARVIGSPPASGIDESLPATRGYFFPFLSRKELASFALRAGFNSICNSAFVNGF